MTEVEPVWIDERVTPSSVRTGSAVEIDLGDFGIVVLDQTGHVTSTNSRARDLLCAETPTAIDDRVMEVQRLLAGAPNLDRTMDETSVEVPGLGFIAVRSYAVGGVGNAGSVLLLRDARSAAATESLLQQAARHRSFAFLARDWAHDLKGMLHVIRINGALLGRLLQRESPTVDAAVTKCLDAIPREVERLDRSIEMMFSGKPGEQALPVDLGAICRASQESRGGPGDSTAGRNRSRTDRRFNRGCRIRRSAAICAHERDRQRTGSNARAGTVGHQRRGRPHRRDCARQ